MAKEHTINEVLKELTHDATPILLKSVKNATDIATKDIYNFSMSVLERYYENYEPNRYDRTYNLWKTTVPISEVKKDGETVMSTVGVEYDSSRIDGIYDGSKKYEHPDGSWIIENFLMGVHPATNGGTTTETTIYMPWQDPISPDTYLKKYLQFYKSKLTNNVYEYIAKYIFK